MSESRGVDRAELDRALSAQSAEIGRLLDAKLQPLVDSDRDQWNEIAETRESVSVMKTTIAITRVKVGLVLAGIIAISSAVASFVTKHFLSIVVTK